MPEKPVYSASDVPSISEPRAFLNYFKRISCFQLEVDKLLGGKYLLSPVGRRIVERGLRVEREHYASDEGVFVGQLGFQDCEHVVHAALVTQLMHELAVLVVSIPRGGLAVTGSHSPQQL